MSNQINNGAGGSAFQANTVAGNASSKIAPSQLASQFESWIESAPQDALITIDPPSQFRSMTPMQLADEVLKHLS